MGWCGKRESKCPSRTKAGKCDCTFNVCPFGPRDAKPGPGDYVEDMTKELEMLRTPWPKHAPK